MDNKQCISTKKKVANDAGAASFKCPSCSDFEIVRSSFARQNAIAYTCPACGFTGPN